MHARYIPHLTGDRLHSPFDQTVYAGCDVDDLKNTSQSCPSSSSDRDVRCEAVPPFAIPSRALPVSQHTETDAVTSLGSAFPHQHSPLVACVDKRASESAPGILVGSLPDFPDV